MSKYIYMVREFTEYRYDENFYARFFSSQKKALACFDEIIKSIKENEHMVLFEEYIGKREDGSILACAEYGSKKTNGKCTNRCIVSYRFKLE